MYCYILTYRVNYLDIERSDNIGQTVSACTYLAWVHRQTDIQTDTFMQARKEHCCSWSKHFGAILSEAPLVQLLLLLLLLLLLEEEIWLEPTWVAAAAEQPTYVSISPIQLELKNLGKVKAWFSTWLKEKEEEDDEDGKRRKSKNLYCTKFK